MLVWNMERALTCSAEIITDFNAYSQRIYPYPIQRWPIDMYHLQQIRDYLKQMNRIRFDIDIADENVNLHFIVLKQHSV